MSEDPAQLLFLATQAALKAGEILRDRFGSEDLEVHSKGEAFDLVTECDHASETTILQMIRRRYPHHAILAEESGLDGSAEAETVWIVDPLDGTVNFAHGLPLFAVSIGIMQKGSVVAGVIYQPITQELFIAQRGEGAYLNGAPLHLSTTPSLHGALVATSLSLHRHQDPEHSLKLLSQLALHTKGVAALGSAVLNIAYVAAGRFDAFWSSGGTLQPWDVAAASLLIEEAGGVISTCNGEPLPQLKATNVLTANPQLHTELKTRFAELDA